MGIPDRESERRIHHKNKEYQKWRGLLTMEGNETSSIWFIYLFILVLLFAKGYYHFFVNRELKKNRTLKDKVCPFCGTVYSNSLRICSSCQRGVEAEQRSVICLHCGCIGEMDKYRKNSEFTITTLLLCVFIFPALIYFFLYRNRRICKNCGRMTRRSDY